MSTWDVHAELYTDRWVDITDTLRKIDGITIVAGAGTEGGPRAGSCTIALNDDGRYSPRNPSGRYYGLIGRNTPLRVWVAPRLASGPGQDLADTFTRTVASGGWGTADSGHTYTALYAGGVVDGSQFSVGSGMGNLTVPAAVTYRVALVDTLSTEDVDIVATVDTSVATVTGGVLEPAGLIARWDGDGGYYMARLESTPVGVTTLRILLGDGSTLASATVPITWSGQALRIRFRAIGTWLAARVWEVGDDEPDTWTVETSDSTYLAAGQVGFRSGAGAGNTNVPYTAAWDDIAVTVITTRFWGEVPSWPRAPIDESCKHVVTTITAAGILRRLAQADNSARPPLERAILATTPVFYAPLTDGPAATIAGSLVPFGPAITADGVAFGQVPGPLGAPAQLPELVSDGVGGEPAWEAVPAGVSDDWRVDLIFRAVRISQTPVFSLLDILYFRTSANTPDEVVWSLDVGWDGGGSDPDVLRLFGIATASAATITVDIDTDVLMSGDWHHVRIDGTYAGSTRTVVVTVDGGSWSSDAATMPAGGIDLLQLPSGSTTVCMSGSVGHIAVHDGTGAAYIHDAVGGYAGESIATRLARLQAQTGVTLLTVGDTSDLPTLAVQRPASLPDLIADIQTADLGMMLEVRNAPALALRTLASLERQTPVELDWSSYQVASPIDEQDDDQATWNDVTAARYQGSKARSTLTTGPLSTNAIGTYDRGEYTTHRAHDVDVAYIAQWLRHLGTWDAPRYPSLTTNLAAPDLAGDPMLVWQLLSMRLGDALAAVNLPSWLPADGIRAIVRGYTEQIGDITWTIQAVTTPAAPYDTARLDTGGWLDCGACTTVEALDTTETGVDVTCADTCYWTHADGDYDIMIGGERMTVTAVTAPGGSSGAWTQTLTVTRSVNGIQKAHRSGVDVHVADPIMLAL